MRRKNKWLEQINAQREQYKALCEAEPSIPLFLQAFWQEAVSINNQWSAVLFEKCGTIYGSLVFCYTLARNGIKVVTPILTQTSGVWIREYSGSNINSKLEYEKEVFDKLLDKIETFPIVTYEQRFTVEIRNWLPLYWRRFKQTTRYTYRILDISDPEAVIRGFSQAKKRNINHAKKLGIQFAYDMTAQDFYQNHKATLKKQGLKIAYGYDTLNKIIVKTNERHAGRTIFAYDPEGNIHAALLTIWDLNCAYHLIPTIDPDYRNSGASTLLFAEIIKYLSGIGIKQFDFEGSMVESIERSYRQFGTEQLPYFAITKDYRNYIEKAASIAYDYGKKVVYKVGRHLSTRRGKNQC